MATQTRNPTSDLSVVGTWSGSLNSRYTLVDDYPDTTPTDVLTGSTNNCNIYFGFTDFAIPAGATEISVQVKYYDQDNSAGTNSANGALGVGAGAYNAATHNPGSLTAREDNWATNPRTTSAWTVDDVNGVGANALEGFGFKCPDASPSVDFSCIQLQVTFTPANTDRQPTIGSAVIAGSAPHNDRGIIVPKEIDA